MSTQEKGVEKRAYSLGEEILNSVTHGIGALLSIAGLVLLIVFAAMYGTTWHVVGFTIFGVSMIILYTFSTLYHSIQHPRAKWVLKVFDHSSIFILIAGTYTAFTLTVLRGVLGWWIFGIIWALAIAGIVYKSIFLYKRSMVANLLYLGMGWIVIIAIQPLYNSLPRLSFIMLVAGGLCYSLGMIFYALKKVKFTHAIWHLFVLGGTACHFFAVIFSLPGFLK